MDLQIRRIENNYSMIYFRFFTDIASDVAKHASVVILRKLRIIFRKINQRIKKRGKV